MTTKARRGRLGDIALPVTKAAVERADVLRGLMDGKPSTAVKAGKAGDASPPTAKLTIMASADLLKRLRATSYWSREALRDIVERAIEREVLRLEAKHGAEPAPAALRPGRKVRPA